MNKKELSIALSDLRESYRLLNQFQKRILDLVKYIGNHYEYEYHGGWPWFSNVTPRNGRGNLDNWSWDWLNMYCYDFHFKGKLVDKQKIIFSILLQSDTGYYDSKFLKNSNIHKNDIDHFCDSKESETRIIFKAGSGTWNMDGLFKRDRKYDNEMTLHKQISDWRLKDENSFILARSYNLIDFIDKQNTDKNLLDFENHCNANGIKLIKEKKENEV